MCSTIPVWRLRSANMTGKKVTSGEVSVHTKIDMGNLAAGIYILQINTANDTRFLKVIKN